MALARTHGSSLSGIWFAMYPFRLVAADPINGATTQQHLVSLSRLAGLELLTLGPAALLTLAVVVLRRPRALGTDLGAADSAVLVVAAYDVFSIIAGGSYWTHYLVQLVVPTALAVGIVAYRLPRLGERMATAVVAASLLVWCGGIGHASRNPAPAIGEALADVSQPGDSVVSALGDADIVAASGLRSDYPYLWSLPARSLDKNFEVLAGQLSGPRPPTWVVVRGPNTRRMLLSDASGAALRQDYHAVAQLCGRTIYLRDSVNRQPPSGLSTC
jgi:hypothetical protein